MKKNKFPHFTFYLEVGCHICQRYKPGRLLLWEVLSPKRSILFTTTMLLILFALLFSEKPSYSFEKDSLDTVMYDLSKCDNCHQLPENLMAHKDRKEECDQCHNPEGGKVQLASSPAAINSAKTARPKDLETMVFIPAGNFLQGSDTRLDDEGPIHNVYIEDYYIDKYEVTNTQYERFVRATEHRKPVYWVTGTYPKKKVFHPVIFVDWFDAKAYCKWAEKRLPTESEWEKAARGTDGRNFPWGDDFVEEKANVPDLGMGGTMSVGSFVGGKSPYGLYDMTGNVWEWTSTWYKPYPGSNDAKTNTFYGEKNKILKGGSWFDCFFYKCGLSAYTFNRSHFAPDVKNNTFGFRCAKSASTK